MTDNLPPLPSLGCNMDGAPNIGYTASEMQAYARAALTQAQTTPVDLEFDAKTCPEAYLQQEIAQLNVRLAQAQSLPDGWPTNEMIEAGRKAAASHGPLLGSGQSLWHIFRDMLAASQQAEAQKPFGFVWLEDGEWQLGTAFNGGPPSEAKAVFTRPQPAQLQALTIRECAEETGSFAHVRSDYMLGIAEAIQSALAAKNGAKLK